MHSRRLACFLLGLWLGGSLLMVWIATGNFRSADRALEQPNPAVALQIKTFGFTQTRLLLRYQISEQNRLSLETWEYAQLFFGIFLFFFFLFGTGEGKFSLAAVLCMLAIVVFQRFLLTPQLIGLGRSIDFLPDAASHEHKQFQVISQAYSIIEPVKWVLGLALAAVMIWRRGRSGYAGQEIDLIDKAYHGHVDR
ncbi:MAG: hypothetical protein LAP87_07545 [Acidobacteriia bacterium]|nr:hypothetical protein [Terriglobia bacterium]